MNDDLPNSVSDWRAFFRSPEFRRTVQIVFWSWYVVACVFYMTRFKTFSAIWPWTMAIVWVLVLAFREPLQNLNRRIHIPVFAKFLIWGLIFTDIIMENLAVSFKGDLHPNLFLNSLLWVGAYAGVIVAWWILSRLFTFTPWQVLFLYGIKGVIIEQNYMVPKMLVSGDFRSMLLCIPLLTVVYGASVAPVFVILGNELPQDRRKPGILAAILAIIIPWAFFYAGFFAWFRLMGLVGLIPGGG
jgi:hypothetical protein